MKYYVEIGERTHEVDVEPDVVRLDGRVVEADLRSDDGSGLVHLLLDGRSHMLQVRRTGGRGWEVEVAGQLHDVNALDERRKAIRELTGARAAAGGPHEVVAPMPGLLVAVEVSVGDEVEAGQGLVVVEAMKMENELRSEVDGTVTEIHVESGQPVEKGQALLVIDPVTDEGS